MVTVSMLALAGFNVVTIRSSDKTPERNHVVAEWNNPDSKIEIFVANVNTLATGANMHMSKGVFACWHLNGDIMHQGCARLIKIGQDEAVEWVLLKVRNSYHDNLERMCVTKWAVQLSAEIALPDWVTDTVREICIYETIKTYWHQGFNRVAWNIVRDIDGGDFEYHAEQTIRIAHICSLIAKMVLYLTSLANEDARIKEQIRYWKETGFLAGTEAKIYAEFLPVLAREVTHVKKEEDTDDQISSTLTRGRRQRQQIKSEEIVTDSDLEDDEVHDGDDLVASDNEGPDMADGDNEETDEASSDAGGQMPTPRPFKSHKTLIPADTEDDQAHSEIGTDTED